MLLGQAYAWPGPVLDAATGLPVPGYRLELPFWHKIFTPFCSIADHLTVLSLREMFGMLALGFLWLTLLRGWKRRIMALGAGLLFLAWGALVPRPMARLVAADPDVLLIDFHSHTAYSHDGRPGFTAEQNRQWHRRQGFHAGFITDHNRINGAREAFEASRKDWRETGYRSLMGEEISLHKTHLVVLGMKDRIDNAPYDSDPAGVERFIRDMQQRKLPVIASLPEYADYHWPDENPVGGAVDDFVQWGISGFELLNSAPKALDVPRWKRQRIVELCRKANLIWTGISDNHGYGYATAAWNAMCIPGWSVLGPDDLQATVLDTLRRKRNTAVQVLERQKFMETNDGLLGLLRSPFGQGMVYLRTLQPIQALLWVPWVFAWTAIGRRRHG